MPGHAASLGAALDHPQPGLREAALRELRQSGAGAKAMAAGGLLSGALLRRVVDDHPRVAAAAASLPGLRVAVGDDAALFDAAAERLATAAGACAGKTPHAEAERAVAKRCARLAVGTLSTPRPTDANGTGETDETGGSSDDDDDDEDETEKEKKDVDVGVGALAGRGAALALGHLIFSPSTRAVARATVEAARRNAHPSLAGVRGDAFAKAMEVANAASGAASPAAPAKRGGAKDRSKTSATVSKPDKESRARADAACNAAVFAALAEGFAAGANAWGGADALRVWTLEAWRDGTSRGRGALLLALRAAVVAADGTPGGAYARDALWALLRETWNAEGGAGTVHADDDSTRVETARADDDFDFSSEFATRAVAKGSSAILPALSRAAARAVARSRHVPPDVLERLFVLASTSDDGDGDGDGTFARILADVVDSARDFVAFLAARAASDPNAVAPRVPRVALALLSSRAATRDGITKTQTSTTSGWVLSILVVAYGRRTRVRVGYSRLGVGARATRREKRRRARVASARRRRGEDSRGRHGRGRARRAGGGAGGGFPRGRRRIGASRDARAALAIG